MLKNNAATANERRTWRCCWQPWWGVWLPSDAPPSWFGSENRNQWIALNPTLTNDEQKMDSFPQPMVVMFHVQNLVCTICGCIWEALLCKCMIHYRHHQVTIFTSNVHAQGTRNIDRQIQNQIINQLSNSHLDKGVAVKDGEVVIHLRGNLQPALL